MTLIPCRLCWPLPLGGLWPLGAPGIKQLLANVLLLYSVSHLLLLHRRLFKLSPTQNTILFTDANKDSVSNHAVADKL